MYSKRIVAVCFVSFLLLDVVSVVRADDFPEIKNLEIEPGTVYSGGLIHISADVSDDIGLAEVFLYVGTWDPRPARNPSWNPPYGAKTHHVSIWYKTTWNSGPSEDVFRVKLLVKDTNDQKAQSKYYHIIVLPERPPDKKNPELSNSSVTPSSGPTGTTFTLKVRAKDNVGVKNVTGRIDLGHGITEFIYMDLYQGDYESGYWRGEYHSPTSISEGKYTVDFYAIDEAGNSVIDEETYLRIREEKAKSLNVSVSAIPSVVDAGESSEIQATVTSNGNPVSGAEVLIEAGGGWFEGSNTYEINGFTSSNGTFTAIWHTADPSAYTQPLNYLFTAKASESGYESGSDTTTVTVNPVSDSDDTTPPSIPGLKSPDDNEILSNQPIRWVFDWEDLDDKNGSGLKGYHIYVIGPNATIPIVDTFVAESHYTFTTDGFVAEHNLNGWTWKVKAQDEAGNWSDWSETWTFNVENLTASLEETVLETFLEKYPRSFLEEEYESGNKYFLLFGAGIPWKDLGVGANVMVDLADYFQITPEGEEGWVTVWETGVIGISVKISPVEIGIVAKKGLLNERGVCPDPDLGTEVRINEYTLIGSLSVVQDEHGFIKLKYGDSAVSNVGYTFVEGEAQIFKREMQRETLDEILLTSAISAMPIVNSLWLVKCVVDVFSDPSKYYGREATCSDDLEVEEPPSDYVEIIHISPTPETALIVGQKITFNLTVDYSLVSLDSGFVTLSIIDITGHHVVEKSPEISGTGSLDFEYTGIIEEGLDGKITVAVNLVDLFDIMCLAGHSVAYPLKETAQEGSLIHFDLDYTGADPASGEGDGNDSHSLIAQPGQSFTMYIYYREGDANNQYIIRVYPEWDKDSFILNSDDNETVSEIGQEIGGKRYDIQTYIAPSTSGTYKIRVVYNGSNMPPSWNNYDRLLGEFTVTVAAPKDSDNDGTSDDQDQCPYEPGPPESKGCPQSPVSFIRNWLLCGPFTYTTGSEKNAHDYDYIGETTVQPNAGQESNGKSWKRYYSSDDYIDLSRLFSPNEYVVGYAHTYIYSPLTQTVQLRIGSDDAVKIWVNGNLLHENYVFRAVAEDQDIVSITLNSGWNRLLIKVLNGFDQWGFYARFTDKNGNEVKGLQYQLNNPTPAPKDSDNDGTPDDQDQCPYEPGPPENKGCPISESTGTIEVYVRDDSMNDLPGASVYLDGTYKGKTDNNGYLRIYDVPEGSYTVSAGKSGYEDDDKDVRVRAGETETVHLTLRKEPQAKEPSLILYAPDVDGLTVTINGVTNPGTSGTTITRIHWEWGDGSSEDHWFPASHTYRQVGAYAITVTSYQSDGLSTTKTVTVNLKEDSNPQIYVHPTSFSIGTLNEGQVGTRTFYIENIGGGTLIWNITINENSPWISVNPSSGITTTETDSIFITVDTTGLTPGKHSGYISVTSNGGNAQVYIEVMVHEAPQIYVHPTSHNFGTMDKGETATWTFYIENTGGGELTWLVVESLPWLSVNPVQGTTTTETDSVTVTVDTTGLDCGGYYGGNMAIMTNGSETPPLYVEVTIAECGNPQLHVHPIAYDFGTMDRGGTATWTFYIENKGEGTLSWEINESISWLTVTPVQGTTTTERDSVTTTVDTVGLAPGNTYVNCINISSNGGRAVVCFQVTIREEQEEPQLYVHPTSHHYGTISEGQRISWTFHIENKGGGELSWKINENLSWLVMNTSSGTTTTEIDNVTATIDSTGLTEGEYSGYIYISSNGGRANVFVEITISGELPELYVHPTSHNFGTMDEGETATWTFYIENTGGGTLTWHIIENLSWLTANPTEGTTTTETSTVTVTVDTTGLAPGPYDGNIMIFSNCGMPRLHIELTVSGESSQLHVGSIAYNFGTMDEGETATWTFYIENTGGDQWRSGSTEFRACTHTLLFNLLSFTKIPDLHSTTPKQCENFQAFLIEILPVFADFL